MPCEDVDAASIDDLVAIAKADYRRSIGSGGAALDVRREVMDLGDREATYLRIGLRQPPALYPLERPYLVALRDGSSLLVSWSGSSVGLFGEIIPDQCNT